MTSPEAAPCPMTLAEMVRAWPGTTIELARLAGTSRNSLHRAITGRTARCPATILARVWAVFDRDGFTSTTTVPPLSDILRQWHYEQRQVLQYSA